MTYEVKIAPSFEDQLKHILIKFPDIKDDIRKYIEELETTGPKGKQISSKDVPGKRGNPNKQGFYKDRFPLEPYRIGKSGGLRIISYCNPANPSLVILSMVYLKSELESPTNQMFKEFLCKIKTL